MELKSKIKDNKLQPIHNKVRPQLSSIRYHKYWRKIKKNEKLIKIKKNNNLYHNNIDNNIKSIKRFKFILKYKIYRQENCKNF